MWSLEQAKRVIVVGGSLAMAYTQLTTSPATIKFAQDLGANGFHIGVLGALPVMLVGMQVLSALMVRRLPFRKPLWVAVSLVQRLVFLPAALGPWLFPEVPSVVWLWLLIALTFTNHAMLHVGNPLWLSWMGDYLPHQGLSKFWGVRHSSQQWTAAATMLVNALFFWGVAVDVRASFAAIIGIASVLGVLDVLLFTGVEEPAPQHTPAPRLWDVLARPFRERQFRSFIEFSCFWYMATMVGAPFITLFLLNEIKLPLSTIMLLWMVSWIGGALMSRQLGGWIEQFGQRPVLVLCVAFKTINMLALLCCPLDHSQALWLLIPTFALDACLNSGITIATNGFLVKNSPREDRTMFVAAGTAYAGLVGGLTSILAGLALDSFTAWRLPILDWRLSNFQLLFIVSIALRLMAIWMALRIQEPASTGARTVVFIAAHATRRRIQSWTRAA
jgi:hypothetical protein